MHTRCMQNVEKKKKKKKPHTTHTHTHTHLGVQEARVVRFETRGGNMKVMGYAEFDVPKSAETAMSLVKVRPFPPCPISRNNFVGWFCSNLLSFICFFPLFFVFS